MLRSWSSTSMYLRHFGLGHWTAKTIGGAAERRTVACRSLYWIRSLRTHSASRAISSSDRPLLRWISVRAILPLVMSRAITSIRPLLPTPQRTWTGDALGQVRRQALDPALADADAGVGLVGLALQHLDAHPLLVLDDRAVDPAGGGRQLRVLGDQDVVEPLVAAA